MLVSPRIYFAGVFVISKTSSASLRNWLTVELSSVQFQELLHDQVEYHEYQVSANQCKLYLDEAVCKIMRAYTRERAKVAKRQTDCGSFYLSALRR